MDGRTPSFRNSFSEGMPILMESDQNKSTFTYTSQIDSPVKPLQIHQPGRKTRPLDETSLFITPDKENEGTYENMPTLRSSPLKQNYTTTVTSQSPHRSPSPKHLDRMYSQLRRRQESEQLIELLKQLEGLEIPSTCLDPEILTKAEAFLSVDKLSTGGYFNLIQLLFAVINHAHNTDRALKIYNMKQKLILEGIHSSIMDAEMNLVDETQPATPLVATAGPLSVLSVQEKYVCGANTLTKPSNKLCDLFESMTLRVSKSPTGSSSSDFSATDYGT